MKSSAQHDFIDHCILSSANGIQREIKVKRQKLGTFTSFKYFGALVLHNSLKDCTSHCSFYKAEANSERWQYIVRKEVKLVRSLVISSFLYASESWTFTAELKNRGQASELKCYWRHLNISYKNRATNEEVR